MSIAISWDNKQFNKEMNNLIEYSIGFVEGVESGKAAFLNNLGKSVIEYLENFIDSMARVDQRLLHHVYEWNMSGNAESRLFELQSRVDGQGLSIDATFTQSRIAASGASSPFYDKARIMEQGIPVTITPKKKALRFEVDGETVFTRKPVTITNPGGEFVEGGFEQTMDTFFGNYFTQSFLRASGIMENLQEPTLYKKYLAVGMANGKSAGLKAGYEWISRAGVNN
jgi:hypothetical protein